MVFKKIIFQNRYVALETGLDPPPLHGKCHLKFPFWIPPLCLFCYHIRLTLHSPFSIYCCTKKTGYVPDQSFLHAISSTRTIALWWLGGKAASLDLYHREIGSHPKTALALLCIVHNTSVVFLCMATLVWCPYVCLHHTSVVLLYMATLVWCPYVWLHHTSSVVLLCPHNCH